MTGDTTLGKPAIFAWEENSSTVEIEALDIPNDGRVYVASDVIDNGDGTWRYEYAIYNLTSDDGVNGFSVPLPAGVTATAVGFHDPSPTPASPTRPTTGSSAPAPGAAGELDDVEFATDPNANAIRWGTVACGSCGRAAQRRGRLGQIFETDGLETITVEVRAVRAVPTT